MVTVEYYESEDADDPGYGEAYDDINKAFAAARRLCNERGWIACVYDRYGICQGEIKPDKR